MGQDREPRRSRAPWFWAVRELADRWKAIVVLGLLAGIAGGVSLAAIAGARRTDAAFPRYKAATGAPDAIVFGTQVGGHHVDYGPVKRLPEVADAGEFALDIEDGIDALDRIESKRCRDFASRP